MMECKDKEKGSRIAKKCSKLGCEILDRKRWERLGFGHPVFIVVTPWFLHAKVPDQPGSICSWRTIVAF